MRVALSSGYTACASSTARIIGQNEKKNRTLRSSRPYSSQRGFCPHVGTWVRTEQGHTRSTSAKLLEGSTEKAWQ